MTKFADVIYTPVASIPPAPPFLLNEPPTIIPYTPRYGIPLPIPMDCPPLSIPYYHISWPMFTE